MKCLATDRYEKIYWKFDKIFWKLDLFIYWSDFLRFNFNFLQSKLFRCSKNGKLFNKNLPIMLEWHFYIFKQRGAYSLGVFSANNFPNITLHGILIIRVKTIYKLNANIFKIQEAASASEEIVIYDSIIIFIWVM